jgi:hypothetical protein
MSEEIYISAVPNEVLRKILAVSGDDEMIESRRLTQSQVSLLHEYCGGEKADPYLDWYLESEI